MTDTVSVIIPAYNAAAYVGRAIETALMQTHPPIEILVVDDGSKDHTANVVSAYEPAVRLIRKPNGGPAGARNLGASLARGRWLALLDADDWWQPEKLAVQLMAARDPAVGLIHCLPDHRTEAVPDRLRFADLWKRNWIVNSSVLIRRDVFEALGGFDEARELISVEDYNLWLRVAASGWHIVTCQQVLMHYTRGVGISANYSKFMHASLYNIDALQKRLNLSPALVRRQRNDIILQFARQALFERELTTARKFFWQAFSDRKSLRTALHLIISLLPKPILDIKRYAVSRVAAQITLPAMSTLPSATDRIADTVQPTPRQHIAAQRGAQDRLRTLAGILQPLLVTTIDAEEDFDWQRPFSRDTTSVISMRSQHLAHRVFEQFGVTPTYMIDYPVASKPEGREPLFDLLSGGHCDIGAQLHTWVTPPFVERLSSQNSFQGNLPAEVELAKMRVLTAEIENSFGVRPRFFRAGRYGAGPNTPAILRQLGYQADSSILPRWSFHHRGGPDFRSLTATPYWLDQDRSLLELPISAATVGRAAAWPHGLTSPVFGEVSDWLGLPSAMTRLGLLERIKLTPEGITLTEAKRLVRHMSGAGQKIFVMTYHSPSLEIGNTPYVKTRQELDGFIVWLQEFLEFFTGEMGGRASTWSEVYGLLRDP